LVWFFSLPNRFKPIETKQTQCKGLNPHRKILKPLNISSKLSNSNAFCVPRSQQIKLTKETSVVLMKPTLMNRPMEDWKIKREEEKIVRVNIQKG